MGWEADSRKLKCCIHNSMFTTSRFIRACIILWDGPCWLMSNIILHLHTPSKEGQNHVIPVDMKSSPSELHNHLMNTRKIWFLWKSPKSQRLQCRRFSEHPEFGEQWRENAWFHTNCGNYSLHAWYSEQCTILFISTSATLLTSKVPLILCYWNA